MALQITEKWESGSGELGRDGSDTLIAIVYSDGANDSAKDADNADDPVTVVKYATPHFGFMSAFGNVLTNLTWDRIAPYTWKFTGTYRSPTWDRQTNDACFSFSMGGGSQHINYSLGTVSSYGNPNLKDASNKVLPAPNFQGAIGVTDMDVEGVEITVPTFDFKTTFYVDPAVMTSAYVAQLKALRGKVNSDTVKINVDGVSLTCQPGELLFLGADGSKRKGYGDWELTLNWSHQENVTNATIGPITGITKNGWDYLWVRYQPNPDASALSMVRIPQAIYVERVYTYLPLTPILLPTGMTQRPPWLNPQINGDSGIT